MQILDTIAQLVAHRPTGGITLAYVAENNRVFRHYPDSKVLTRDGSAMTVRANNIISDYAGGDGRWVKVDLQRMTKASRTANQGPANFSAGVKVTIDNAIYDFYGNFSPSNNRIIANKTARYALSMSVRVLAAGSTAGDTWTGEIRLDGAAIEGSFARMVWPGAGAFEINCYTEEVVSTGSYIEFFLTGPNANRTMSSNSRFLMTEIT